MKMQWFEENQEASENEFRWYRDFFKRFFDVFFSIIAVVVLAIPMIIIAAIIKITSPKEPFLFRQIRVGKNGKLFKILKFRTMNQNAPHQMATEEFEHPEKYITTFGKLLRKSSLDELPQLFNVIRGDMSIIGPRPLIPSEEKVLKWRDEFNVSDVLPGITGLAQVHGRDKLIGKKKAFYDGRYVDKVSIVLDLRIFLKTVVDVIHSRDIREGKVN